jgi:hypothetical protein
MSFEKGRHCLRKSLWNRQRRWLNPVNDESGLGGFLEGRDLLLVAQR